MTTKKQKFLSIINICNVMKPNKKKDIDYWILKIKDICEEGLK